MMMETAKFKELLNRYRTGKASAEEEAWLESWYMDLGKTDQVAMDEAELTEARKLIWEQFITEHPMVPVKRRLWPRIAAAAAAVAAIVFGVWFFNSSQYLVFSSQNLSVQSANDILPGKNTATLTLANGKTINLSDAKTGVIIDAGSLKYNDGSLVQNSSGSHFSGSLNGDQKNTGPVGVPSLNAKEQLTVSTPRGGTYQVRLPDGTNVWLNAASSLTYSADLIQHGVRGVKLSGEAYFEVAKNKAMPFRVLANGTEIEVLGTHFNVDAYDKQINTTLLEGAVRLKNSSDQVILRPGQSGISENGKDIKTQPADIEAATAWKNGYFVFHDENIKTIMDKISRWYDIDVEYRGDVQRKVLYGKISRADSITDLLKNLQLTQVINLKIEGRRVIVMP
jgi:transmembrane sensor